ncbi:MerC domain-containing protein [Balneola sp. MJW-20]|uniref:MerC domain-containing protein n=1 Tax=Gracilimonas aurantiaca TaxID=3234185 RepID=UPI00346787CB
MADTSNNSKKPGFWDRVGIGLSGICAIHCLLIPISVSLIPLWPALEELHGYTHLVFFLAISPAVYFSLKRKHAEKRITVYLITGLSVIFLAWFFNESLGDYGEAGITLVGSMLLIRGHWINYRSKMGFN